jgi:hypothetical protein
VWCVVRGCAQGARMAARVCMALNNSSEEFTATPEQQEFITAHHNLNCYIFIGGVSPMNHLPTDFVPLLTPTLHIMGANDPYIEHSRILTTFCDRKSSLVLNHQEGHNIPSLRTGMIFDMLVVLCRSTPLIGLLWQDYIPRWMLG